LNETVSKVSIHRRLVGKRMGKNPGQPMVIENRPGSNSMIAAEIAARARQWLQAFHGDD
jgi:tripartite-type tricarboxylate transporter receptor subunit TctC